MESKSREISMCTESIGRESDIGKYSNSVDFDTEVYPGVHWVPINILGSSRYSNEDMEEISKLPIEKKREKIGNLYEAVQLFQISDFKGSLDNTNHWIDNNELWQTHKNQVESVISNEGCCATDTNWLAYFIRDKYDFVGSFCYANTDGNGHVTTYIRQSGYYYFLDMMMCRKDSQEYLCKENGVLSALLDSEWAGFLYKCEDPVDFCYFNISRFKSKNRDIPYCFYMRATDCVSATGVRLGKEGVTFLIPQNDNPTILYLNDNCKSNILIVVKEKLLVHVERINNQNRDTVNNFILEQWYTTKMILRGKEIDMTSVEGVIVFENDEIIGLITYIVYDDVLEITSLDSLCEKKGIGTMLIEKIVVIATEIGCKKIVVITTNDNINAIRFYQRRGFDMANLYRNALDISRKLKPEIPLIGEDNIPLRHEIEFEMIL